MPESLRVAVTVEQSWQRSPGGTAASTNALLAQLRTFEDLDIFGVAARHGSDAPPPWQPPVPVHHLGLPRQLLYRSWHALRWPPVDHGLRPSLASGVDVVHATSPAVPPASAPLVTTIHDLAFLTNSTWFSPRGVRFFRRGTDLARRHAVRVVVPSTQTRDDCIREGFEADRIRVVPHGVRVPAADSVTDAMIADLRHRVGVARPYILWCGTHEPRKNLTGLVAAFSQLVAIDDPGVDLVLVGPEGWGPTEPPPPAVAARIHRAGFLSPADLQIAYRGAEVFCYPSFQEGFGMPVLEAMAQGVPVVTSAGSPMADVGADACVTVDPNHVVSIRDGLTDAMRRRAELAAAARPRAAEFTWERAAAATATVYREAATEGVRSPSR